MDIPNVSLSVTKTFHIAPIVEQVLERLFANSACESMVHILIPPTKFVPNRLLASELVLVSSQKLSHAYLLLLFNQTRTFTIFDPSNSLKSLKEAKQLTDYRYVPIPCPRAIQYRTLDVSCLTWCLYFMTHVCQNLDEPVDTIERLLAQTPEQLKNRLDHFVDYIYVLVDDIDPVSYLFNNLGIPNSGSFDDVLLRLVSTFYGHYHSLDHVVIRDRGTAVPTPLGLVSIDAIMYMLITQLITKLEIEAIEHYIRASEILATNDPSNIDDYNLAIGQIRTIFERLYTNNSKAWDIVYHYSVRYNVHDIYDIHRRVSVVNDLLPHTTVTLYRVAKYRDMMLGIEASDVNSAVMLLLLNPAPFYDLYTFIDGIKNTRRLFPKLRGVLSFLFGVNTGYFSHYINALVKSVNGELTKEQLSFLRSVQIQGLLNGIGKIVTYAD